MPRKKSDEYEEDNFLDEVDGELEDEEVDSESESAEEEEVTEEEEEEEPKPKAKRARKPAQRKKAPKKKKAEPEPEAEEESEAESEEKSDESPEEEAPAEEEAVEEEIDYPPDDKQAVAALQKLKVRLDVSEKGNVWRVIFDDSNGKDPALLLLNGLPALKELWLLGTKVTQDAADKFKEDNPKINVYY